MKRVAGMAVVYRLLEAPVHGRTVAQSGAKMAGLLHSFAQRGLHLTKENLKHY